MTNKPTKKVSGELLGKANKMAKSVPSLDALAFITSLAEAHKEQQITKKEIARIDAQREVLIESIRQHYDFYRELFERIFDERRFERELAGECPRRSGALIWATTSTSGGSDRPT